MVIEKIIQRLKNDPNYKWDSNYTLRDLTIITQRRAIQVLRGLFLRPFL